jgi:uncharacterized protein with HEPN domain
MRRDPQAFRNDGIEAGNAMIQAVYGISLEDCEQSRLIRSSVEREFILIGEALKQLSQHDDTLFVSIEEAPQIILPRLVERCNELLRKLDGGE